MACLFIRFVGVAMETGLAFTNHTGAASCPEAGTRPDGYQWYKGYADVIDKLVTKCWQKKHMLRRN